MIILLVNIIIMNICAIFLLNKKMFFMYYYVFTQLKIVK